MNILIIDNNIDADSWGSEDLRRFARQASGAVVHTRRAPQGDLPASPDPYDRIIVSGSKTPISDSSPWVLQLLDFIRASLNKNKPYLGVCYGHQMLARAVSGDPSVGLAALGEIGWTKIEVTEPSKLFEGLPREFYSFSSHYDEVKTLPPGFRSLAHSSACGVQAMQLGERPVYGIQFHPERDPAGAERRYLKAKKEKTNPKFILNESRRKTLFDPQVGERIFGNFLTHP